jgi:hypothetical protein
MVRGASSQATGRLTGGLPQGREARGFAGRFTDIFTMRDTLILICRFHI